MKFEELLKKPFVLIVIAVVSFIIISYIFILTKDLKLYLLLMIIPSILIILAIFINLPKKDSKQ